MKLFNQIRGGVMMVFTLLVIFTVGLLAGVGSLLTGIKVGHVIDKYLNACMEDYKSIICTGVYVTPRLDKLAQDYLEKEK